MSSDFLDAYLFLLVELIGTFISFIIYSAYLEKKNKEHSLEGVLLCIAWPLVVFATPAVIIAILVTSFVSFAAEMIYRVYKRYFKKKDKDINEDFKNLHTHMVNEVIEFCNKHNISIDEFHLEADNLSESIEFKKWHPSTDSSFTFNKWDNEKEPFLFSV